MSAGPQPGRIPGARRGIEGIGARVRGGIHTGRDAATYVGGLLRLYGAVGRRVALATRGKQHRIRAAALVEQGVRVGVRSVPIVVLVQIFIGIILVLSMARPLEEYGQLEKVADVVALAIFREMGPLISAIILSGFAGASIAAELGAMVEGEEIKALRAHALDPIRFLVVPRVLATTVMMIGLTVLADVVGIIGGLGTGVFILDLSAQTYIENTQNALSLTDYVTGLVKGGVFGAIIAGLACYEGLNVRGGAEGVGRATTTTVVKCIVCLIGADCLFTGIFYALRLF
jgi:phospholipid/cholesterol/gamma-HCH transport system permease protein